MEYRVESWRMSFFWCLDNSFWFTAIHAPPAPALWLPHSSCLVSFAEQSKETLPPCIHLEGTAVSRRVIPTKEVSIGTLIKLAAKWGSSWSSHVQRKSLLMLLEMVGAAVKALWKNWLTRSFKEPLYWKSQARTSTTKWGSLKVSVRRRNNDSLTGHPLPYHPRPIPFNHLGIECFC